MQGRKKKKKVSKSQTSAANAHQQNHRQGQSVASILRNELVVEEKVQQGNGDQGGDKEEIAKTDSSVEREPGHNQRAQEGADHRWVCIQCGHHEFNVAVRIPGVEIVHSGDKA